MTRALPPATRIRFGPEIFRIQRHGGVSRYVVELHGGLLDRQIDSRIVAGLHSSQVLGEVPDVDGIAVGSWRPDRLRQGVTRIVDERWARRAAASLGPGDVWHPSYFPRHLPTGPRLAITVYDMIHERYPEAVGGHDVTAALKAVACRAADVIFCISQTTADDLVELLGVGRDRIHVTPLGVAPVVPQTRSRPFGDRPYLVYLGERRPAYKNWPVLLDALAEIPVEVGLVCIGPPPSATDHALVSAAGLEHRVMFEGGSDTEVAGRLGAAAGLVYPSRYEGFGLPPLEALAQGCPVVAAATGAIPEVVGDLAILVDPTVDGVGGGITELLAEGGAVQRQRDEGPGFAARYSWSDTVEATLDGYRRLLG